MFGSTPGAMCCRPYRIVEVDPAGKVVWEVEHVSPLKTSQQRVYPSDSIMGRAASVIGTDPPGAAIGHALGQDRAANGRPQCAATNDRDHASRTSFAGKSQYLPAGVPGGWAL